MLHPRLKMRLYVSAVCSIMIYGSEAWILDAATQRALNGANSKMVSQITGRTIREEAVEGKTYDVVAGIRATRLRWLGLILRMVRFPPRPSGVVHELGSKGQFWNKKKVAVYPAASLAGYQTFS